MWIFRCVLHFPEYFVHLVQFDLFGYRTWQSMANTPMSSSRERWIFTDPLMEFGTTTSSPAWTIRVFAQATCFHFFWELFLTSCLRHNVDRTGDGCACTATHGLTCVLVVVDQCFMYRHCMHTKSIGSRAVIWLRERYWRMAGQDMLIGTSTHLSKACWEFGDHWKWNDWF